MQFPSSRAIVWLALSVTIFGIYSFGQETLTNESIIKLISNGLSEDLVVNLIRERPGNYTLGADDIVALKNANVSERVIGEMIARRTGNPSVTGRTPLGEPPATVPPAAKSETKAPPSQSGLYYRKNAEWFELIAEDVNWKTTGMMKNLASAGIVRKDLKGAITNASSLNLLTNPMEISIHPPAGVPITDFLLLPLRQRKGLREFEVGPTNKKSGVAKGAIQFGVEKLGEQRFRLVLPTPLGPGEYGLLPFTSIGSDSTSSKIYTFRILL